MSCWHFSELKTTLELHNSALDLVNCTCGQVVLVDLRKAPLEGERLPLRRELVVTSGTIRADLKEKFARSTKAIFMAEDVGEAHNFCNSISKILNDMPFLELSVFSGSDDMLPSFFHQSQSLLLNVEFPSQITNNIFLGDFKSARYCDSLTSLGIKFVIDVSNMTRGAVRHEGMSYLVIEKDDKRDEDVSDRMYIREILPRSRKIACALSSRNLQESYVSVSNLDDKLRNDAERCLATCEFL
jgi:hypothetical protein